MSTDGLFVWVPGLRGPAPEWWSDEHADGLHKRAEGGVGPRVLAKHKLLPGESLLPFYTLAIRYPAPEEKPVTKFKITRTEPSAELRG